MSRIDDNNLLFNPRSIFTPRQTKKSSNLKTKKTSSENKSLFAKAFEEQDDDIIINDNLNSETSLEESLKEIGLLGEKLKRSKSLQDLDDYKKSIKRYIDQIIDKTVKCETKYVWSRAKKEKIPKIHLKIIDRELEELTKIFFDEQKSVFLIASKIDKIEGILVDLSS